MADVLELPAHARASAHRRKIANYLRTIADGIEADELETEPHGFILVLTGRHQHEVLSAGYGDDADGFDGAATAAQTVCLASYRTTGGNIRQRNHARYGGAYTRENVVQFAAPRPRADGIDPERGRDDRGADA